MPNRAFRAVTIGASVVAVLSSCASKSSPRTATLPPGTSQAFQIIDADAYRSLELATNAYVNRCAQAKGYASVGQDEVNDVAPSLTQTRDSFGPTTEAAARLQGLHTGPVPNHGAVQRPKPSVEESAALADCFQKAVELLGDKRAAETQFIGLVDDVTNEYYARMNPEVDDAEVAARKCVADSGWKVVRPADLTNTDVNAATVFGVNTADSSDSSVYIPLPHEIDLALALMRCRVKLGLPDKLLGMAKQIEMQVVDKYYQRILEVNKTIASLSRRAPDLLK